MAPERIKQLLIEAAHKRASAKNSNEFMKWEAIYTALKSQWNKKTGNALILDGGN